ncbi:hypothetical protein K3495_g932 [Podosphaera aphanis]|nr:hypothetical protein K3495_g932 [Podosphaera aphanis]
MRPPNKSTQIASSIATSANATALPSRVINSKAISADKAISILETHASSYHTNSDVKHALILGIDTLRTKNNTPQLVPSVHPDLRRLVTKQTDRVIQKLSEGVPAQSYATALNSIPTPLQHEANVSPRITRELTIKPTAVIESLKNATSAEIVRETTRALGNPSASDIAARKLTSGDIHLKFASVAKKNLYENDTKLRSLFRPDCSVRSRGLPVVAHGIPTTATDPSDLPATAAYLKLQNPHWPLEINFLRLGWPLKVKRLGLQTGSLIITLASEDQANALIHHGLIIEGEIHTCEVYSEDCKVTRCFRCQKYHRTTAKFCHEPVRCGFCAGAHATSNSTIKETGRGLACRACGKTGHTARAKECPTRAKEVIRARQAYASRPVRCKSNTPTHQHTNSPYFYRPNPPSIRARMD